MHFASAERGNHNISYLRTATSKRQATTTITSPHEIKKDEDQHHEQQALLHGLTLDQEDMRTVLVSAIEQKEAALLAYLAELPFFALVSVLPHTTVCSNDRINEL